jgi:MurNAc alpha-1-phosphate uridylyltransferase
MNILVLAAGYGNRMDDLTKNIPKPMLKINQKMLIDYAIEIAQKISHQRIFVNTHYQNQILESYIKENYIDIFISYESNILGTGGAIKKIQNDDLLILNTDNLWQETFINEINEAINFFNQNINIENLLLVNSNGEKFDLEINIENQISFPSDNYNTQFQGCHIIRNKTLTQYPDIFNIQDYWINSSIEGKLYGYETVSINPHVGTKELYLKNR